MLIMIVVKERQRWSLDGWPLASVSCLWWFAISQGLESELDVGSEWLNEVYIFWEIENGFG